MCGNGVAIGMKIIARHHRPILRVPVLVLPACSVGAAGSTARGNAVSLFVAIIAQAPVTTATASASPFFLSK